MSEIKCIVIILALKMFEETISVLRQEIRRVIKVSFRCYASLRTEGNHFQRLLKYDE